MFGDIFGGTAYKKMPFYLQQDNKDALSSDLSELLGRLGSRTGSDKYSELFIEAFNYFVNNPEQYDGASGDQELDIITKVVDVKGKAQLIALRYDITSIIHDYLDAVGMTYDFERMQLSNKFFDKMNIDMGISYWNREKRKLVGLGIVSRFRLLMRKVKKTQKPLTAKVYKVQDVVYRLNDNHVTSFRFLKMFSVITSIIVAVLVYLIIK